MNKKQRETIAAQFVAIGERFGAAIERRDEPRETGFSASIYLNFSLNGVGASLNIDDLHGGEEGLISWFNSFEPGDWHERYARLGYGVHYFTSGFVVCVGDMTGKRKAHKATSCGPWDVLAARLQAGLRKASNGGAFQPDSVESV